MDHKLDLTTLDVDGLRKASLPLNGNLQRETDALAAFVPSQKLGSRQIVTTHFSHLYDDSTVAAAASHLRTRFTEADDATILDFLVKNLPPREDEWRPDIPCFQFVELADLNAVFDDDEGWERFRELYPDSNGSSEFSRVGLNQSSSQAILCFGTQHHWLSGFGTYAFLVRKDDQWEIKQTDLAWMS